MDVKGGSHWVPSPTHVNKVDHGCKVPTFQPRQPIKVWFHGIQIVFVQNSRDFLFDPTLNTWLEPRLYMVFCHVGVHVVLETQDLRSHVKQASACHDSIISKESLEVRASLHYIVDGISCRLLLKIQNAIMLQSIILFLTSKSRIGCLESLDDRRHK